MLTLGAIQVLLNSFPLSKNLLVFDLFEVLVESHCGLH